MLIDTYKISTSDGSFFNFKVTNGRGIKSIAKTSTDVLSDTYTISYNDNTSSTYTITNGRGIDYIEKDETIGLSDRYTIHYNDGSTSYYYVTNGEAGPAGGIGNRIYLSGLVNKVNDEEGYKRVKELKESKFDLSKFTVVGSPTITDDGIASGFSTSNYIQVTAPYNIFVAKVNYLWNGVNPSGSAFIFRYRTLSEDNAINIYQASNGQLEVNTRVSNTTYYDFGRFTITANKPLNIIIAKTSTSLKIDVYQNDVNIFTKTVTSNIPSFDNTSLVQFGNSGTPINGSIDLKQFSITVDGKEVFSGNKTGLDVINEIEIPYTLSKTGSKIVDAVYRDRVEDCYNQYGTGNYYLFSSATEQFALPMPDLYGLIENLKLDITAIEGADW